MRTLILLTSCLVHASLLGVAVYAATPNENADAVDHRAVATKVDARIAEKLIEQKATAGPLCDDETFLRRISLDLTGRNPLATEVVKFVKDTSPNKRSQYIDRLLESPAAADHLAETWSGWLLPEMQSLGLRDRENGLQTWLRQRFSENLRYDRLVADLLVAKGASNIGPTTFFLALESKPEKIAAKTARVFMGVQLDCAECHDHPFDHWKQRDFWDLLPTSRASRQVGCDHLKVSLKL